MTKGGQCNSSLNHICIDAERIVITCTSRCCHLYDKRRTMQQFFESHLYWCWTYCFLTTKYMSQHLTWSCILIITPFIAEVFLFTEWVCGGLWPEAILHYWIYWISRYSNSCDCLLTMLLINGKCRDFPHHREYFLHPKWEAWGFSC